jgi:hypothetical protein
VRRPAPAAGQRATSGAAAAAATRTVLRKRAVRRAGALSWAGASAWGSGIFAFAVRSALGEAKAKLSHLVDQAAAAAAPLDQQPLRSYAYGNRHPS